MSKSISTSQHIDLLSIYKAYLIEKGWEVTSLEADVIKPYNSLTVSFYSADSQICWNAELSILPVPGSEHTGFNTLQCFIPLQPEIEDVYQEQLTELIVKINTKLPLVGFGFIEDYSLLYFKHNQMLADDAGITNVKVVNESLTMISYLIASFSQVLINVATGDKTITEAIDDMPFKHLFM